MTTNYNLTSSMSDRYDFDEMISQAAEGMLQTLPFNEGREDDAWQQEPELYAQAAFENFESVAATIESGEEAVILVDDMDEAKARYMEVFPQAVRNWQKEMMVDYLAEKMSGDEGKGYTDFIIVSPGGYEDGLAYNPVTIDIVGLEADGDQVAYRQSDDGQDGDWEIGGIEDAVEEALSLREQLVSTEKEIEEMAAQDEILAALG